MNVQMIVEGPRNTVEFRSLYRWLRNEGEELRAAGITMGAPGSPPGPHEMGGAFEIVQFAFDTVAQYGALALAIVSWRKAHAPRSALIFERNGVRVSLEEAQLLEEESVRRALQEVLGAQEPRDEGDEDSETPGDAA